MTSGNPITVLKIRKTILSEVHSKMVQGREDLSVYTFLISFSQTFLSPALSQRTNEFEEKKKQNTKQELLWKLIYFYLFTVLAF